MRTILMIAVSALPAACQAPSTLQVEWQLDGGVSWAVLSYATSEGDRDDVSWFEVNGGDLELVLDDQPRHGWVQLTGETNLGPDGQLCELYTSAERAAAPLLDPAYFPAGTVNVDFDRPWDDQFRERGDTCQLTIQWDKDTVWHDPNPTDPASSEPGLPTNLSL